jgi:hypothetical protein
MSKLHFHCYSCYGLVEEADGSCPHCGGPIEAPPGAAYDDLLLWALRHPVPDVAITAARILGARREVRAAKPLRSLIRESDDPYLAAQAVRSLAEIEGLDGARDLLVDVVESGSVIPAAAAAALLDRAPG